MKENEKKDKKDKKLLIVRIWKLLLEFLGGKLFFQHP